MDRRRGNGAVDWQIPLAGGGLAERERGGGREKPIGCERMVGDALFRKDREELVYDAHKKIEIGGCP